MTDNNRNRKSSAADAYDTFTSGERSAGHAKPVDRKKKAKQKKNRRIAIITILIIAILLAIAASALAIWAYKVTNSPVNYPKVYISGIFVGDMTREETADKLRRIGWGDPDDKLTVSLPAGHSFEVDQIESGMKLTPETGAELAYAYGRDESLLGNLKKYLGNHIVSVDVDSGERTLNEAYVRDCVKAASDELDAEYSDGAYKVDEERQVLTMVKGGGRMQLDRDALYSAVIEALRSGEKNISFDKFNTELSKPDFQAICDYYNEIPTDAHFDEQYNIIPEAPGCYIDPDEAEHCWQSAELGQTVEIPILYTQPEVTAEYLQSLLYRDVLGFQTTSYKWSSNDRINNIKLACSKIDGLILLPGETFSYNTSVGQRTEEAGFRAASAYSDGQVVEEVGGGICQVSSTLYCASMYSQLKTVTRTNHYFKVDYLPYGMDATVSWKKPDFQFKNTRDFPVKIATYCDDDEQLLTIAIYGTDIDGSYVDIRTTQTEVYDETYKDVLIGYTVIAYRMYYDADGNFLYEKAEPGGVYYFHDENIDWPEEKTNPKPASSMQPVTASTPSISSVIEANDPYDSYLMD